MKKVTGIGGLFMKCNDPDMLGKWYQEHLGISIINGYGVFQWRDQDNSEKICQTIFSLFKENTTYFQPSNKDFMFNYRVENIDELLAELKNQGVEQIGDTEVFEYGKFAWVLDPEGNKIELWEPYDEELGTGKEE